MRPQRQRQQAVPQAAARQPKRTLDITLVKVDATMYDTANPDSDFYTEYFTNPNDDITERLDDLDYTKRAFTISLQSGITNFEVKDIDKIPLKEVLYSKFKNGDYETGKSKSDANVYIDKLNKIMNNYPSFKKYKPQDDLSWVVRENRLLLCEMLEYAIPRGLQLPSIEGELVAIMRVCLLALGTKQHPLYIKLQTMLSEMRKNFRTDEGENDFNESELKRGGLIPWHIVTDKQKELEYNFNRISNKRTRDGYFLNQDLVLLSLYSLIPPLRNEPKTIEFTTTKQDKGNWIYIQNDKVTLDLIEIKKRHESIELDLPEHLQKILRESYTLYPRQYAFTDSLKYPDVSKKAALSTMNQRLENLFKDYKNPQGVQYKVQASMLRSSYVTFRLQKQLKYNQLLWIAKNMRTSVEMLQLHYFKIITQPMDAIPAIVDIPDEYIQAPVQPAQPIQQQPEPAKKAAKPQQTDAYQKHLKAGRDYYKNNKDKILPGARKYRREHKKDDARRKILKFLNNDPTYKDRIKQTTVDKYDIKKVDGKYV